MGIGDEVQSDLLPACLGLIAGVDQDVGINGDHAVCVGWETVPPRRNACV
jgi:hypothetical protein